MLYDPTLAFSLHFPINPMIRKKFNNVTVKLTNTPDCKWTCHHDGAEEKGCWWNCQGKQSWRTIFHVQHDSGSKEENFGYVTFVYLSKRLKIINFQKTQGHNSYFTTTTVCYFLYRKRITWFSSFFRELSNASLSSFGMCTGMISLRIFRSVHAWGFVASVECNYHYLLHTRRLFIFFTHKMKGFMNLYWFAWKLYSPYLHGDITIEYLWRKMQRTSRQVHIIYIET